MKPSCVAIVGASGRMGQLFAARSRAAGVAVRELSRPLSDELFARQLPGADLVVLSVPADAVAGVCRLAAPRLDGRQTLADVCSVKVRPVQAMLEAYAGPVAGTHPLFGPDPGPGRNRVALAGGRGEEAMTLAEAWFTAMGFPCFATDPETHDRAMALVQSLNFVTTVAYLATLAEDENILDFLTPSFDRRLAAARKMLTEDSAMFSALFEANPFAQDAVRRFRTMLGIAMGGDVDLLCERAGWWWRDIRERGEA
ncbi:MAG: prephenate dehydrogenase/arogenate dehydrogenase family protein [Thermodesulfobacteriota bacterium]